MNIHISICLSISFKDKSYQFHFCNYQYFHHHHHHLLNERHSWCKKNPTIRKEILLQEIILCNNTFSFFLIKCQINPVCFWTVTFLLVGVVCAHFLHIVFPFFKASKRKEKIALVLFYSLEKKVEEEKKQKKTRKTSSCVNKHLCEFICIKWF